jgi:hypothetical protein
VSRPARFKQADATRAMRAAAAAGLKLSECVIDVNGAIRLIFSDAAATKPGGSWIDVR